jgi:hypothetical protein
MNSIQKLDCRRGFSVQVEAGMTSTEGITMQNQKPDIQQSEYAEGICFHEVTVRQAPDTLFTPQCIFTWSRQAKFTN